MTRIRLQVLLFLIVVLTYTTYGQNTLLTSFGLRGRVSSFSAKEYHETGLDEPRKFYSSIRFYTFDKKGKLRTVIDSISGTKTVYEYNKGFANKILTYKGDTLNETMVLHRYEGKIIFQSGQMRGYYLVDNNEKIIETALFAAATDSVIYKESLTYDENSITKSWHLINGTDTMKIHFTNTVTQRDENGNCISYNSMSDNIINKKTIHERAIRYR